MLQSLSFVICWLLCFMFGVFQREVFDFFSPHRPDTAALCPFSRVFVLFCPRALSMRSVPDIGAYFSLAVYYRARPCSEQPNSMCVIIRLSQF